MADWVEIKRHQLHVGMLGTIIICLVPFDITSGSMRIRRYSEHYEIFLAPPGVDVFSPLKDFQAYGGEFPPTEEGLIEAKRKAVIWVQDIVKNVLEGLPS
jgi:hypothetical protein